MLKLFFLIIVTFFSVLNAADGITELKFNSIHFIATHGNATVGNLSLNHQGNRLKASPGEKIFARLHFFYDSNFVPPTSLNQILIGFSELGAQKCIYNQVGYLCGEGDASFFLQAPSCCGVYQIRFRDAQAYTPEDAVHHWWDVNGEPGSESTIGELIVE